MNLNINPNVDIYIDHIRPQTSLSIRIQGENYARILF